MKTLLKIIILGPIAIVIMALAVVNNQPVTIALDPFTPKTPLLSLTVPLYALFFATLLVGVVIGGVAAWSGQSHARRAAREGRREVRRLTEEVERQRDAAAATAQPALTDDRRAA